MKLTTEKNGTRLTVHISGELNTETAPELAELLNVDEAGVTDLTLDFAECKYVSSAGLRVLLDAYKKLKAGNGSMKLLNANEYLQDVLKNTGLDELFGPM